MTDWARQLLLVVRRWWPDRPLVAVADSTYATLPLPARCQHLPNAITFITLLRLDEGRLGLALTDFGIALRLAWRRLIFSHLPNAVGTPTTWHLDRMPLPLPLPLRLRYRRRRAAPSRVPLPGRPPALRPAKASDFRSQEDGTWA